MLSRIAMIEPSSLRQVLRVTWRNLAFQDGCCLLFHASMWLRLQLAPAGPHKDAAQPGLLLLFLCTAATVLLVRGEVLPPGRLRALVYRVGLIAPMPLSYFTLRHFLPALQPILLDARFLRLDERLFGQTPARLLEPLVSPWTTEWFAFYYYSYFAMTAVFVLGTAFFDRGRRQIELLVGAMTVVCVGHTLYGIFPGVGPYATLSFGTPLRGGVFFRLVEEAVASAGAMYDIFPSLHTADPTLFALHALRHRRERPFRYVWPVVLFFTLNMVTSTLFLRWHYGVDVLAGLTLAVCAQRLGILVAGWEGRRRGPTWEALVPADEPRSRA